MTPSGTPNGEIIRNFFTIQAVVGLPFGTSKYPAFVVHPFPYPVMQMHELVHGYEMPEHYQDRPRHAIHLALQWQDEIKSDSSMTMARIAEKNGFSRARVTQIMGFLKLDREIQRLLMTLSEPSAIRYFSERKLRQITSCKDRKEQVMAFKKFTDVYSGS